MVKALSPATSLVMKTAALTEIADKIDSGIEITESVKSYFNAVRLKQSEGVDEFLDYRAALRAQIETMKDVRNRATERIRFCENLLETGEKAIIELLETNPDLPFTGSFEKLTTAKNPPAVEISFKLESKSLTNIVPDEFITMFGVSPRFYDTKIFHCLKLKEIGDALKDGEELCWAMLTQGKKLKPKLKD